ncbi:kinesin motor protein cin8 [Ascosphaera acerosa]|nr:kinesin motor protein cin8 [Ascosphaera acerosa]
MRTSRIPSAATGPRRGTAQRHRAPSVTPEQRSTPAPTATRPVSGSTEADASAADTAPVARTNTRDFDHHGPSERTNIHVVVRCRGRNEQEVSQKSGMVISTEGIKGETLEVNMGPNALSNKVYQFDRVYSPAADQSIVFDDAVVPVLNEVRSMDTLGILSDAAGIIPRVLYALFQKLEDRESSVKCSFIELYNEELRDLLSEEEGTKLKIYDDNAGAKKGSNATMVQGMGETWIHDASQGIKLLQTGSFKRQVAATKCNDLSSRSHTIFTITAYIKRTTDKGDEVVTSGKLNLVDLAGSENIGRSGAENKRATEAGLINKSLLTLGRVINALVDGTQHIPYRESKLTRLLQDSLGGHTKTCIIATISPSNANLEETVSTLDYAFRAKNIRNKPQTNSSLSKKTLLREFTTEIEKLKAELIATRLRNGVYLPNQQYEELTMESESRRILTEEQRAKIESMETSLRNKLHELMHVTGNFNSLKKDHEETKKQLKGTDDLLQQTDIILTQTKRELEEEMLVRQAHAKTEEELRAVGSELISQLKTQGQDVEGLLAKIVRKEHIDEQNQAIWQRRSTEITEVSGTMSSRIDSFKSQQTGAMQALHDRLQSFITRELEQLDMGQNATRTAAEQFEGAANRAEEESERSRDSVNIAIAGISDVREDINAKIGTSLGGLTGAAGRIADQLTTELTTLSQHLNQSYTDLNDNLLTAMHKLSSDLTEQRQEAQQLREELKHANARARKAEAAAKAQVQQLLEREARVSEAERISLLNSIRDLIAQHDEQRAERVQSGVTAVWTSTEQSQKSLREAHDNYNTAMTELTERSVATLETVAASHGNMSLNIETGAQVAKQSIASLNCNAEAIRAETERIVKDGVTQTTRHMATLDECVTRARATNDDHHASRTQRLNMLTSNGRSCLQTVTSVLEKLRASAASFGNDVAGTENTLTKPTEDMCADIRAALQRLREIVRQTALEAYTTTGQTPVRRERLTGLTPGQLPRTRDRQAVLAQHNGTTRTGTTKASQDGHDWQADDCTPVKIPVKLDSPSWITKQHTTPRRKIETGEETPLKKRNSPEPFAFTRASEQTPAKCESVPDKPLMADDGQAGALQAASTVVEGAQSAGSTSSVSNAHKLRELDSNSLANQSAPAVPALVPESIKEVSRLEASHNAASSSTSDPSKPECITVGRVSEAEPPVRIMSAGRKRPVPPPTSVRKASSTLSQRLGRRKVMEGAETPATGKKRRTRDNHRP